MAKLTLTYFDFSGSRGEECRLALFLGNADFHDNRIDRAAWLELKPTTPFGSMPLLEAAGRPCLSQSNAILSYVGRTYGLLPVADPWECARLEAILAAAEDLRAAITRASGISDPDALKAARAELCAGPLTTFGNNIERQIRGPFVSGEQLTVADIKLFIIVGWMKKGVLDHVPTDVLSGYPKLEAVYQNVNDHPRVQEWYKKLT
jgi:glutathione S-transferase